jgi:hypothetical protein
VTEQVHDILTALGGERSRSSHGTSLRAGRENALTYISFDITQRPAPEVRYFAGRCLG